MSLRRRWIACTAPLLAALLSGCEPPTDQFPPACPQLSLLKDARQLTLFAGTSHDVTDMALSAQITAIPARCAWGKTGSVRATLSVAVSALRGPAAKSDTTSVDYFIALTEGGKILREQDFRLPITFPQNVEQVTAQSNEVDLLLPVGKSGSAAGYQLYVGFRLTPDQLAYNRQRSS